MRRWSPIVAPGSPECGDTKSELNSREWLHGSATVSNYVLLKAAEETLARGYDLFLIIDSRDASQTGYTTFGQANAYASVNAAYGFGSSTTVPISKLELDSPLTICPAWVLTIIICEAGSSVPTSGLGLFSGLTCRIDIMFSSAPNRA